MENLRISTMTAVSSINSSIDLDNLFMNVQPNELFLIFNMVPWVVKGQPKKKPRKSRVPKKQKSFFNQVTLHVQCEKNVNVKLFNNGKIQMTGLKYETHGDKVLEIIDTLFTKTRTII